MTRDPGDDRFRPFPNRPGRNPGRPADRPPSPWSGAWMLLALAFIAAFAYLYWQQHRRARPGPGPEGGGARADDTPYPASTPVARVDFLDVGQGDSILIRSPEGKVALVDAGPSHRVVDTLERLGVDHVDLVVVTHHHADHYGGMAAVIDRFAPRAFLDADSPEVTRHYADLLDRVRRRGMQKLSPEAEARPISLGSVKLEVFPQPPIDRHRGEENNNSVGIRVIFGAFSVLLTGDSETEERGWWLAHSPSLVADASVLKLAHHGSRNGVDADWLAKANPKLAVASLGRDNEYGHPHPETLELLRSHEVPLLRTDRDGTVEVVSDGETWKIAPQPTPSAGQVAATSVPRW